MTRHKYFLSVFAISFGILSGCQTSCNHSVIVDESVAPTCTTHGLTEGTHCELCNQVLVPQEIIEPLGHEAVIDNEIAATCTRDGRTAGVHCERCNAIIVMPNVIEHMNHTVVSDLPIEAACTTYGLTEGSHCETCNEVIVKQEIINPLGHDVVIDDEISPTCEEDGLTAGAHCARCHEEIVTREVIGHHGHTIVIDEEIDPTCVSHGLTAGAHCETCGAVLVEQHIVEPLGHDMVIDPAIEATCEEEGRTEGAHCNRCNYSLTTRGRVAPKGHDIVIDPLVMPTCTSHGLTEGVHCATCDKVLVEQQIIDPLGHDVVIDEAVEPTCTEDGLTAGAHCARCHEVLIPQEAIGHTGHIIVKDEAVAPTCTTSGLTEGEHCATCGEILVPQNVVEPTGHDYGCNDTKYNWTNEDYEGNVTATVECSNDNNHSLNLEADVQRQTHSPTINSNGYVENTATVRDEFGIEYSDTKTIEIDQYSNDIARNCEHHWIRANSNNYSLICDKCLEKSLPIINIDTEEEFTKEYVSTTVSVEAGNDEYNIDHTSCQVKIRGNGTALLDKKPYRLKFDKKQKMLGLNNNLKAKSWVLLAEHNGLMQKSMLGFMLSKNIMGNEYYSSDFTYVNLYINNHYHGVYLLAEQQQVNEGRININEPKKNYEGTDIGYLVEMDEYWLSEENYFEIQNLHDLPTAEGNFIASNCLNGHYSLKSDVYTEEQLSFIQKVIHNVFEILYDSILNDHSSTPYKTLDDNYNLVEDLTITNSKQAVEQVIDLESLIRMFILQEIVQDYDIGWSSFYMYIDCSEIGSKKVIFTAPWDFDLGFDWVLPSYLNVLYLFSKSDTWHQLYNPWFMVFATSDWFLEELRNKWNNSDYDFQGIVNRANALTLEMLPVIFRDYLLWPRDIYEQYTLEDFKYYYLEQTNYIYEYINTKVNNLNVIFAEQEESETTTGYVINFQVNNDIKILVYEGKDYTIPGNETLSYVVEDMSGDGQLNFKVIPADGYELESITVTGTYKNLKGPADTGVENVYRLTKVASDLVITVNTIPLFL